MKGEHVDKFCEVAGCNNLAVVFVRDIQEVKPQKEGVWIQREPIGPPHCFCKLHERDSITYPRKY